MGCLDKMIYEPEKDSYLLQKVLQENILNKNISAIEIGIGSGIQLQTLKKLGVKEIQGVDLNSQAVEHCKKLGFNVWQSDLFEKVREKYNLIIFNPPYLPEDKREDEESKVITTGGKEGSEIINEFLRQAKDHLKENGKIFLLISNLAKGLNFSGYNKKVLEQEKLFFEKLEVLELTKS